MNSSNLYLDLLKKCLTNSIYDDDLDLLGGSKEVDVTSGTIRTTIGSAADASAKYFGRIWPSRAHTMIGLARLDNVQHCIEQVLRDGVPGDLIETGVWRGGTTILMRGILKAYGANDRIVWVADSFEGLPPADRVRYPKESGIPFHRFADLAVSLDEVRGNFERYGLLDEQVQFLKGWFRDTLPSAPFVQLSVVRLDGDMYESTMDGLVYLYPKLAEGGYMIVDDYNAVESCNDAVSDFCHERNLTPRLQMIPGAGAFWRK